MLLLHASGIVEGVQSALPPGSRVGRYIVLEGDPAAADPDDAGERPGYHVAHDPELDRRVVLVRLSGESPPPLVGRARALGREPHANLLAVHDVGEVAGGWYVAAEYVAGFDARAWLLGRPRTPAEVQAVFRDAARGLLALHQRSIVHGSVGLDRIIVGDDRRVRLDALVPPRDDATAADDRRALCRGLATALRGHGGWLATIARRGVEGGFDRTELLLAELERDPYRRPRRIAIAGVGLGVAVAGAIGVARLARPSAGRCDGASALLTDVWTPEIGEEVGARFVETGIPYAAEAHAGVARRLDAWAQAWIDGWTAACEATRGRGDPSATTVDPRMQCLSRRREEAEALTRVFRSPDADIVRESVTAAAGLTPIVGCAQAGDADAPPVPDDPRIRERVEAVRRDLTVARALRSAGKYDEGIAVARAADEAATELGFEPLRAEALVERGRLEHAMGELVGGGRTLREGLHAAWRARHDAAAIEAWFGLVESGRRRALFDDAHRALRHAAATLDRVDGTPRQRAWLVNLEAGLLVQEGRYEEALDRSNRAVAAYEALLEPDDPRFASIYSGRGNALQALGRYDEAMAAFRQGLRIAETALGAMHPTTADLFNNIGLVEHDQGKHDEALAAFERAYEVRRAALGAAHPVVADSLNNLAFEALSAERFEDALRYCEEALRAWKAVDPDHPHVAGLLVNIGIAQSSLGRVAEALATFGEALEVGLTRLGPEHPTVATTYHNIGGALSDLGRNEEAVEAYQEAARIRLEVLGPDHPRTRDSVGMIEKLSAR